MIERAEGGPAPSAPAFMSASRPFAVLACRFRTPSIGGAARRSDEDSGREHVAVQANLSGTATASKSSRRNTIRQGEP